MRSHRILLLFLVIPFFLYIGCTVQNKENKPGSGKDITVTQLREQMQNNKDLVILDVRTVQELTGPLPKIESAINIPLQELDKRFDELKPYKDKQIAVICRTGHRSSIAYGMLKKKGYNVENVLGGMTAYLKK